MKILIVEDNGVVRESKAQLLDMEEDVEVVGSAEDGGKRYSY